jgi:hypothetical protein
MIKPLAPVEAKQTREALSRAVRDLCWPKPIANSTVIPYGAGVVVAFNISPFPGQAVGVRDENHQDAYSFPIRAGIDTVYLTPEQLPMLMLPELRRVVTLLYAINVDSTITFQGYKLDGTPIGERHYTFKEVDEINNVACFTGGANRIFIPLDQIQSVWKAADGWHVTVRYQYL